MENMIQTRGLTKSYGNHMAVNDVSISLRKGDIYGLIGKNGAGKSTLFKLIMGLTTVSSGELSIMQSTTSHQLQQARRNIGFMMGANFYPYLGAKENLEYYRRLKGIVDGKEVDRVLTMVELDKVSKPFKTFSMGMKQRLGIASAMMGNPDIIILDEPTNGLDPQGIADFRNMIKRLNQEYGITFIISSHILGELGLMASRFGFIDKGKLIQEIDRETLHDKTRKALLIKVDDTASACVLLEQQLKTVNYVVNSKNEIILSDCIDKADEIAALMVGKGLRLFQLYVMDSTLEDYFLDLIGGKEHA